MVPVKTPPVICSQDFVKSGEFYVKRITEVIQIVSVPAQDADEAVELVQRGVGVVVREYVQEKAILPVEGDQEYLKVGGTDGD